MYNVLCCTPQFKRSYYRHIPGIRNEIMYAYNPGCGDACIVAATHLLDFPSNRSLFVEKDTFELGLIYYAVHGRLVFIFDAAVGRPCPCKMTRAKP